MSSKYQVKPFKIDISAADLDDLMLRLKRTRFSHDFGNDDWRYGYNTAYHRELIEFLINKYDWRDVERRMNDLPQFKIDLMGVPLTGLYTHFPAQTSHYLPTPTSPKALPMIRRWGCQSRANIVRRRPDGLRAANCLWNAKAAMARYN